MTSSDTRAILDCIAGLAEEIARSCPEAAGKAQRIIGLLGDLECAAVERDLVRDVLEAETAGSDLTNAQVASATDAVIRAFQEDAGRGRGKF